jgi:hypothetical protein
MRQPGASTRIKRLLPLLVCTALAGCNGGTVDRHALSKDGDAVDSIACEGALLAGAVSDGDSTTRFARVHAGDLADRASNFEDALTERPTASGIEADVRALGRKAGRISDLLARLHEEPDDRGVANELRERLSQEGDCR